MCIRGTVNFETPDDAAGGFQRPTKRALRCYLEADDGGAKLARSGKVEATELDVANALRGKWRSGREKEIDRE